VKCKQFGTIDGNPADSISNILLRNITATAETPALKNRYPGIKAENVIVNGSSLVINKE
jgi:hypothetical protein